jgi:hypothetical protein
MQKAMGIGVDLLVALDAVHVEAHPAICLYKDFLCEWMGVGVMPNGDLNDYTKG